jgi:hypothetical protein
MGHARTGAERHNLGVEFRWVGTGDFIHHERMINSEIDSLRLRSLPLKGDELGPLI